jgi:hypothetical protein
MTLALALKPCNIQLNFKFPFPLVFLIAVLFFGQFFGMLPVTGLSGNEVESFSFRFHSFKVFFSISLQVICFLEFVTLTFYAFSEGLNFDLIGSLLHYFIAAFSMLYMFYQATKWKEFLRYWMKHGETFFYPPYSNLAMTKSFVKKVKIVGVFIIGYTISKGNRRVS